MKDKKTMNETLFMVTRIIEQWRYLSFKMAHSFMSKRYIRIGIVK